MEIYFSKILALLKANEFDGYLTITFDKGELSELIISN